MRLPSVQNNNRNHHGRLRNTDCRRPSVVSQRPATGSEHGAGFGGPSGGGGQYRRTGSATERKARLGSGPARPQHARRLRLFRSGAAAWPISADPRGDGFGSGRGGGGAAIARIRRQRLHSQVQPAGNHPAGGTRGARWRCLVAAAARGSRCPQRRGAGRQRRAGQSDSAAVPGPDHGL
ncbi:hypothetical protein D3C75_976030 [compost metagenome]